MDESTDIPDAADDGGAAPADTAAPNGEPENTHTAGRSDVMIGIRTREASRIYHFAAPRGQVFVGDYVVVDRARGEQLARVATVPDDDAPPRQIPRSVRPIVRLADADDRDRAERQRERADQILQRMRSAAVRDGLGLYPVAVELNLDGDRGTAWFQAPEHVDFRPLLQQIEGEYDVELRMQQANERERASLVDGYDICGLRLCCSSWMTDFPHVGIRVAKDQDLSLNPDSISGVCGRLLCCLTFEHEVYREMRGTLPRVGKRVSTPAGMGKVIKLNVLRQNVTIVLDDHSQRVEVPAAEIGLAVRTEDAPNQALVEAEREQRQADRQAEDLRRAAAPQRQAVEAEAVDEDAPPARRRQQRTRKSQSQHDPTSASAATDPTPSAEAEQPEQSDAAGGAAQGGARRRSRQRGKRRRTPVANQGEPQSDSAAQQPQPRDGESPRPRRRRRSRRPVNRPQSGEDSSS